MLLQTVFLAGFYFSDQLPITDFQREKRSTAKKEKTDLAGNTAGKYLEVHLAACTSAILQVTGKVL